MAFCEPALVETVTRVTPNMIRVTLAAIGEWHWPTDGSGDERIDLAFPDRGESVARVDFFNRDDYGDGIGDSAEDAPPWRHYTVRAVRDAGRTLDIDFVVHSGGLASDWVQLAEPGHVLGVFRGSPTSSSYYEPPADADWQLLVADATGLPGLGRIVEELAPGARAVAVVEVESAADVQSFETAGDVEYHWLHGSGLGLAPSALGDAIERLVLPEGRPYGWVACEAAESRRIRRHLRAERGFARDALHALGYWSAGRDGHIEQSEAVGADDVPAAAG